MQHNFADDTKKIIDHLIGQFNTIKTGRANPAVLDNVMVMAWGDRVPLNQVASIMVADATMMIVKPYDKSTMKDIEKGIAEANLGINPIVDSESIRLPVPPLTEETRKVYIKKAKGEAEEARIALRLARQNAKQALEKQEKDKLLTEDQLEMEEKKLQIEVDKITDKIEALLLEKEKVLMQV